MNRSKSTSAESASMPQGCVIVRVRSSRTPEYCGAVAVKPSPTPRRPRSRQSDMPKPAGSVLTPKFGSCQAHDVKFGLAAIPAVPLQISCLSCSSFLCPDLQWKRRFQSKSLLLRHFRSQNGNLAHRNRARLTVIEETSHGPTPSRHTQNRSHTWNNSW